MIRKAAIIGMCAAAVALSWSIAFAEWLPLNGASKTREAYSLTLIKSTDEFFTAEFELKGFEVYRDGGFDKLTIPDAAYVGQIGKPALPAIRKLIQIPARKDFRVEMTEIDSVELQGLYVEAQQPFVTDDQLPLPSVIDAAAYASDRLFPEQIVEVARPAIWGGIRAATLSINPLRFNPGQGALTAARRIRFTVYFEGVNTQNALMDDPGFVAPGRRRLLSKSLFNYRDFAAPPAASDAETSYLIVIDEAFEGHEKIAELAARHEESGHVVEIAAAQDITGEEDPAGDLKDFIQSVYDQSSPRMLEYVLFIGDQGLDLIPMKEGASGKFGDAPYTFLEGDDYLSDVALGRLPAKTEAELEIMIDKILFWSGDDFGGDWLGASMLAAHRQGYPDKYTAACEAIRTHEYRLPPPIFTTQYGGEEATNESLTRQIDEGRVIISYRGHGNSVSWLGWSSLGEYFNTGDVAALSNDARPSILFSIACENADMSRNDPCFAESWLIHPAGGAAAVLGSIYASYTIPNDEFNKYLFKAIYDDGVTTLGDVINKANADVYAHFLGDPTYEDYTRKNIDMYLWLGDPAMSLPITELDAPYNLNAEALDTQRVVLEWVDQSDDEDYFILEMSESDRGDWRIIDNLPADETSYEYDGFTEAQGAYFRMKAVAGETQSYYSNIAYAQTLPAAPDNLQAEAQSLSSVRLSWSDNSIGESGYRIHRRLAGETDFIEIDETGADVASFTDEGLAEGSGYEYVVEAFSAGGASPAETPVSAATLCAPPVELEAESYEDLTVSLRWIDASGGEDSFIIYRKAPADSDDWEIAGYAPADASGYTDAAAGEARQLAYAISAQNSGGVGPKSEICFALTVPSTPRALTADAISNSAVALSWTDSSLGETHFMLSRSFDGGSWEERALIPAQAAGYRDDGLVEGQIVYYRLYAVNDAGNSRIGNTAQTRTLPRAPSDLAAASAEKGVILTWTDNSGVESGYRIERRLESGGFETIAAVGENDNTYTDKSATPSSLTYRVAAFHGYGDSEYSNHAAVGNDDDSSDTDDDAQSEGVSVADADDDDEDAQSGCGW